MEDTEKKAEQPSSKEDNCNDKNGYRYHRHFGSLRFLILFLGGIIIFGGIFALGRMSTFQPIRENRVAVSVNRGEMRPNFGGRMMRGNNFSGVAISGDVTKIDGNNITVSDGTTNTTIVASSSTSFIKNGAVAKQSDLQVNNNIIVSGTSNSNGQISATAIRIN